MHTRLSDSALWQMQRQWYADQGMAAWTEGQVPSGVLTSPRSARQIALLARAFVEDVLDSLDPDAPLFVLDLGAGSGRLGWHLQRELYELLSEVEGAPEPVVVLTDFAPSILEGWAQHPQARDLPHARLDAMEPGPIQLVDGTVLDELVNPLVAIGSYFFDALPADVYEVRSGALCELHLQVHDGHIAWQQAPVKPYDHAVLDAVLHQARRGVRGAFVYPSASVRLMERLQGIAPRGVCVVALDKAICHPVGYPRHEVLGMGHNGALSLRANLHALGCWATHRGGEMLRPSIHDPRLSVAVWSTCASPLPRLARCYREASIGLLDFRALQMSMLDAQADLDGLVALLRLSWWDPDLLLALEDQLLDGIEDGSLVANNTLREALVLVAERGFVLDEGSDIFTSLATLAVALGDVSRAISFLRTSLRVRGERAVTWTSLAGLYDQAGQRALADEAVAAARRLT